MPSDQLAGFFEIVVLAGLIALSAIAVAFSTGVAVALLATRPKRVAVPAAAPAPAREPAAEQVGFMHPTAA